VSWHPELLYGRFAHACHDAAHINMACPAGAIMCMCVLQCCGLCVARVVQNGRRNDNRSVQGSTVVAITSGANLNFDRLRLVADLANYGLRTEAMLTCTIPERPGSFRDFIETLYAPAKSSPASDGGGDHLADPRGIDITEFKYRYSVDRDAKILLSISAAEPALIKMAVEHLNKAAGDFVCVNVTDNALAQVHLRHMVGGRPRSYSGVIEDEKMVVVRWLCFHEFVVCVMNRSNDLCIQLWRNGRTVQARRAPLLPPDPLRDPVMAAAS
jgi:hypothetical protein